MIALAKWRGSTVTVAREDPNTDIVTIRIDPRDGTPPQELVLYRRNDVFQVAAMCAAFVGRLRDKTGTEYVTNLSVTFQPPDETPKTLKVPDWATRSFFVHVFKVAFELGWQGECPQPGVSAAYRR